jgi:hypothetical protein
LTSRSRYTQHGARSWDVLWRVPCVAGLPIGLIACDLARAS